MTRYTCHTLNDSGNDLSALTSFNLSKVLGVRPVIILVSHKVFWLTVFLITFLAMLTGCSPQKRASPQTPQSQPPKTAPQTRTAKPPKKELSQQPEIVPTIPKLKQVDWQASLLPLVEAMPHTTSLKEEAVLLVGQVNNKTPALIAANHVTTVLYELLAKNKKFVLIIPAQIALARQTLGISEEDILNSRSKTIGLARHLGAKYLLYTDIIGDKEKSTIVMQLMLGQTGEIIWSGDGAVKH